MVRIKSILRKRNIIISILLLSLLISIFFYPFVPEKMPVHWNSKGEVDGYTSKFVAMFLISFVMIVTAIVFFAIPKIDPMKANIEKFRKYYENFIILILLFLLVIQVQMLLWSLGIEISSKIIFPIGIGILFFNVGILCENSKRNWFIGIRTPWTMSSDSVWDKTHKIGGILFKLCGIITAIGIFFSDYIIYFIIIPILVVGLFTAIYSFIVFRMEKKAMKHKKNIIEKEKIKKIKKENIIQKKDK